MNRPIFYSIILFYNKSNMTIRTLKKLIDVIIADNGNYFHNILLVDNGSDKNQLEYVENEINNLLKNNEIKNNCMIETYSIYPNQGFGKGMNAGLKKQFDKGANQVLSLSNDVEISKDFFKVINNIDKNCESIVCPHTYFMMDKIRTSYTHGIVNNIDNDIVLSHDFDINKKEIIFPEYYPAAAMLWSKESFYKTNGFNQDFYCYWEDVELSLRCKKHGVKLISISELKIYHLGKGTTAGKKKYIDYFNQGKEMVKNMINKN